MDYIKAEEEIKNVITNSSNVLDDVVNFLYENFKNYSWVGIYIVKENNLILRSWNGPHSTEHVKIPIGEGICGSAASTGKTELIDDVHKDSRYLSCFVTTRSEIVVPIKKDGKIIAEIDIDSDIPAAFSKQDAVFLEKIADMLGKHM
ncbi:MAG: GAF domain-containing protein [Thermoplasmatales archaeon]|nr:MAG: GAF domain-containing protein [Thermoplasmatales archaeon]